MTSDSASPSISRTDRELRQQLTLNRYRLSAKCPARWMADDAMGPTPLSLAEALAEVMPLQPGSRALHMGCGRAPDGEA